MTPMDDFEKTNKLEGIFIPYMRERRDLLYDSGKNLHSRFVHYTTAEAAIKIIRQKKLWLRNTTCMADYGEVHHGFKILQKFFQNKENGALFRNTVNGFAEGASDTALNLFDKIWKNAQFNIHIGCVSEHRDDENINGRLSMWRAFGSSTAARVAIVFKLPWRGKTLPNFNLRFCPVAYMKQLDSDQLLHKVIENMKENMKFLATIPKNEITNWIYAMVFCGASCLKHDGFEEEREWRVVYCPPIDGGNQFFDMSVEIINGIPQRIYHLPLDGKISTSSEFTEIFDQIIIGPTVYRSAIGEAFATALSEVGVLEPEKKIFVSDITIRT